MKIETYQKLTLVFHPTLLLLFFLRKIPLSWFFELRLAIDGIDRPYYAYCLFQAALEAKALHLKKISAIEFGVAAGNGLISLERLSKQVTHITGIEIDIYGFDLVTGLPKISDYRDLPYIWKKGFCKMNVSTLRKRLKRSTTLILGDVKDTVPIFLERDFSPIGFIAFDLDYYTSTKFALRIFHTIENNLLPRIFCYFDNIIGTDEEIMCEFTGEQLSIREFNNIHKNKKIAKISGLYHKRIIKSTWSDMVYVMHSFKHTLYNRYIYPSEDRQDNLN